MGNCCASEEINNADVDVKSRKNVETKKKSPRKRTKKGTTLPEDLANEFTEDVETNEQKEENLWEDPSQLRDDGKTDEEFFMENDVVLTRKGKTLPLFKAEVVDKVREHLSDKVKARHEELGSFAYRKSELDNCEFDYSTLEVRPVTKWVNDLYYLGQWSTENNTREGRGIGVYEDGSIYEGFWKNDNRNGAGRIIYSNGDVYQGLWLNDTCSGYGIFVSLTETKLKGNWKDGKLDGKGFEVTRDGVTYRGDFKKGVKDGKGRIKYKDGSKYEGGLRNNLPNGEGEHQFQDGRGYKGGFRAGKMHGKGKFTWPNGSKYEGDYVDDQKSGYGVYTYDDGIKSYDGEWLNNKQHGIGTYTNEKSVSVKYEFAEGKMVKKVK